MYFNLKCPKCDKTLKVKEELAGSKAGCPYCKAAFIVPQRQAPAPTGPAINTGGGTTGSTSTSSKSRSPSKSKPAPAPSSSGGAYESGTDVSLLWSGLIGLGGAIALLGFLYLLGQGLPDNWQYLPDLFLDRGGVPYALALLFCWSGAILVLKSRKLARQKNSMLFDVLPTDISETISIDKIEEFYSHVRSLPVERGASFLIDRVLRGLEHFRVRKSAPEVATFLESQSDLDANAVGSSYTMLKFFIWAIPIMGFIGTVIGISAAVGGFSGDLSNADMDQIKESLGNVTGGLSTAFDTTLLALVMSVVVMFSINSMQKAEDDMLGWVDEYCNENLLKRLDDGRHGGAARSEFTSTPEVQRAIDSAMAGHHAELEKWSQKLEAIGKTLTKHVNSGWTDINDQLTKQHEQKLAELEKLDEMATSFQQTLAGVSEKSESVQQEVSSNMLGHLDQLSTEVKEKLSELSSQTGTVQEQVAASMSQSADTLNTHFTNLERGLTKLSEVLENLGEKNVVVQVQKEEPVKRGWFSRGRNGGR